MPEVLPQIILGNPASGEGSDSVRTGFAKYNGHSHKQSFVSFFQIDVQPGYSIQAQNVTNKLLNLFPSGTVITEVLSGLIRTSEPALYSTESDAEFTINGIEYVNLNVVSGTNEVSFNASSGFLSASLLSASLQDFVYLHVQNPAQYQRFHLIILPTFSGIIQSICSLTSANQCEARVLINDDIVAPIHTASTGSSSTNFTYNSANNLIFTPDDVVSVELFNITGPLRLNLNLYYFKRV